MIKKSIGSVLILLGIFFVVNSIKYINESRIINNIRQNGIIINGVVSSQDCDKGGSVTFKIEGKLVNYKLDSDCSLFQIGDTVQFRTIKPYKKYIFINESISSIAILFGASLGLVLLISGLLFIKK